MTCFDLSVIYILVSPGHCSCGDLTHQRLTHYGGSGRRCGDTLACEYWCVNGAFSEYWCVNGALSEYWCVNGALSEYWCVNGALSVYWCVNGALSVSKYSINISQTSTTSLRLLYIYIYINGVITITNPCFQNLLKNCLLFYVLFFFLLFS